MMYKTPAGGLLLEEKTSYTIDKSIINKGNMHLTVTNRRPQFSNESPTAKRHQAETQLYQIFKKYV